MRMRSTGANEGAIELDFGLLVLVLVLQFWVL